MFDVIKVSDLQAPELDIYARLTENQLFHYREPERGIFIAESPKVIGRALDAGYLPLSVLTEPRHIQGEGREILARCGQIPVYTAELEVLKELTGFPLTRGMLCAMYRRTLPSVEEILRKARRIAVLEEVENPTNVGALFRSAAALYMDGILLTYGCSDPLYRRAARVSMGTVFQVPWTFIPKGDWPDKGLRLLKEMGFATAAMALREESLSIADERLKREDRLALVLGTEGDGLGEKTIADCDYTLRIPMSHGVDSLNVAAAGAVAFWELGKS